MRGSGSFKISNDAAVAVMIKNQDHLNYCYFQCPESDFRDVEYDYDLIDDYRDTNFLPRNNDDFNSNPHEIFLHILITVLCFVGLISAVCGFIILFILHS